MNKLFCLFGLVLFLYTLNAVNGLKCYSCTSCTGSTFNSTNCTVGSDTCMSTKILAPGFSQVTKACVPKAMCQATGFGIGDIGFYIGCCTTDNCNFASSISPKIFMFFLPLFLLLSYFR